MKAPKLTPNQIKALRMADRHFILRAGDGKWRGMGDYSLIHLHPDNETSLRTIYALMDRGLMGEASSGDKTVFALTAKGRYALQQVGKP